METTIIECPCGEVAIEVSEAALAQLYCHCDDCQLLHGAAYVPAAMYRVSATRVVRGTPITWKHRTTTRATCGTCGTRVYAEPEGLGVRSIMASLLPDGAFRPEFHMQCQHARLPVRDGLPHFKGFPARFGGSDERVEW